MTALVAITLTSCQPSWKSQLSDELADARQQWTRTATATVTYTVEQTVCGGCDAGALTDVAIVWRDGEASTTATGDPADYSPSKLFELAEDAIEHGADEDDVTLAFDDATGLPTRVKLTWDAVDDGDFGFVIEVMSVE